MSALANKIDDSLIRQLNEDVIDQELSRRNFWYYYKYINADDKDFKKAWWQEDAAGHLQQFYEDYKAGLRPILVLCTPPQHGKSRIITDFIGWWLGKEPNDKSIFASYSETLGVRSNIRLQRTFDSAKYKAIFPETCLNESNVVTQANRSRRNSSLLELINKIGYFRNTTVRGGVTGEGLDFGVIDDPLKGREEANSKTIRDKTWDWFLDDFYSRFSDRAGLLMILTRWHQDDPVGRMEKEGYKIKKIVYAAIAEKDETYKYVKIKRKEGDPLFPEHKSLEFLMLRKKSMHPASWLSLYQQRPVAREGGMVKRTWLDNRFKTRGSKPVMVVQSWDCASKAEERNDPNGCGTFAVFKDHVEMWGYNCKRREFPDLLRAAKDEYNKYKEQHRVTAVLIEDKDAGQQLGQMLKADKTITMPVIMRNPGSLDKETRLDAETPFLEAGNLWLPEDAPWVGDFIDELCDFPGATHDESADILSQFLNWLRTRRSVGLLVSPGGETRESPNVI